MSTEYLKPMREEDRGPRENDQAVKGFPLAALERILSEDESTGASEWRDRTAQAFAYYDGDNMTQDLADKYRKSNMDPRNPNLCARVVNVVLGQEEKSRRDPKAEPDEDEYADVADVMGARLKEAQRETGADSEIGEAYAAQVKGGLGWVGVAKRSDPFLYSYLVESIPWREMSYGKAKRIDLLDCQWIKREQWKDLDAVVAAYPDQKQILEDAVGGIATWDNGDNQDEDQRGFRGDQPTRQSYFRTRRSTWSEGRHRRIKMYEVEYKVPAYVAVMKIGHRVIIVDEQNPAHVEAISRGSVKITKELTNQIRRAMFAGPVRLSDEATTLKRFSKVPFFAFRRDGDNTPYGLIEGMIGPQDDFSEASWRIRWMLQAQQLLIDSDALDTKVNSVGDIIENMMRPDMVAVMDPKRKHANGMQFRNDFALQKELYDFKADSKQLLQDVPGIYNASMGNGQPGGSSGIAISSLVEQGMVQMGELNGNYAIARRATYELLTDLITGDLQERNMAVFIGTGMGRRKVILNTTNPETGEPMNMVKDAPVKIGLGEVPSSPAYQMQMSQMMGQMITALAGTPQASVLIPTWVEQTSAFGPSRKQIAHDMRVVAGLPLAGDKQAQEEAQKAQTAQAAEAKQMQQMAAKAELDFKAAQTNEVQAKTQKLMSEVAQAANANQPPPVDDEQLIGQAIREAMYH